MPINKTNILSKKAMRLWSLHPKYLDQKGLGALWREALLAQAVIRGQTKGYTRHPQLERFYASPSPAEYIAAYLHAIAVEASARGYHFDTSKIGSFSNKLPPLLLTTGQLAFEGNHLLSKLTLRSPHLAPSFSAQLSHILPHPLFVVGSGEIAPWEKI